MAKNLASVFAHDAVADAQSKARALANFLGGEEWVEDALRKRDAVTVVAKQNLHKAAPVCGLNFNACRTSGVAHSVVSIVKNIQKYLLQLVRVTNRLWQFGVELLGDLDTPAVEVVGAQLHRAAENGIELDWPALRRHLTSEAQQILHDLLGPLRLLQNDAQVFPGALGNFRILHEEVGKTENRGERVVDFMSDAGDELAHRGHFLRVQQFGLQCSGIGDVTHDHDNASNMALLVPHGTQIHGEVSDSPFAMHNLHFEIVDLLSGEG